MSLTTNQYYLLRPLQLDNTLPGLILTLKTGTIITYHPTSPNNEPSSLTPQTAGYAPDAHPHIGGITTKMTHRGPINPAILWPVYAHRLISEIVKLHLALAIIHRGENLVLRPIQAKQHRVTLLHAANALAVPYRQTKNPDLAADLRHATDDTLNQLPMYTNNSTITKYLNDVADVLTKLSIIFENGLNHVHVDLPHRTRVAALDLFKRYPDLTYCLEAALDPSPAEDIDPAILKDEAAPTNKPNPTRAAIFHTIRNFNPSEYVGLYEFRDATGQPNNIPKKTRQLITEVLEQATDALSDQIAHALEALDNNPTTPTPPTPQPRDHHKTQPKVIPLIWEANPTSPLYPIFHTAKTPIGTYRVQPTRTRGYGWHAYLNGEILTHEYLHDEATAKQFVKTDFTKRITESLAYPKNPSSNEPLTTAK